MENSCTLSSVGVKSMISEAKAKTESQHLEAKTKAEARVSEAKAAVSEVKAEAKAIRMRMQKLVTPSDCKATTKKANGLVLLVVVIHVPVNLFFLNMRVLLAIVD